MDDHDDFLCPKCKSPVLLTLTKVPSPVPCIFHSNEPPTRPESKLIRDTLNEADQEISTIDAEIARIEAALEKLRSHREALVNHRAAHSTLLSPLRRLPPELLSEVFIHLSRSNYCPSPFDEGPTPWVLSQVCRRWRYVALSTPALWTILYLNYHDNHPDPELALEAVSTWLSSSGQLTLSLSILFPEDAPASSVRRYFELIPALSHRLKALELDASRPLLRTLFSMLRSLPRLKQLSLWSDTDPEPDEGTVAIVAPKLTTVSIWWLPPFKFHLPWSQLTDLITRDLDVTSCLSIIASSSSLQSYFFSSYTSDPMPLPSLSTPIISNIRSLSLEIDPECATCLLSNLTLPLLSEFKYTSVYMQEFGLGFKELAERSQFSLRKLEVACGMGGDCGCYQMLSNLTSLSKLEELKVCFGGATMEDLQDSLRRIMDASGPSPFTITHHSLSGEASLLDLPQLRVFILCSLSEEGISMLVDMVRSPWKAEVVRYYDDFNSHRRSIILTRP